jgi:hypothetical protein
MLWWVSFGFLVTWLVLTFLLHKTGFVHMLLLASISIFVVQFAAYRKTKFQKGSSER